MTRPVRRQLHESGHVFFALGGDVDAPGDGGRPAQNFARIVNTISVSIITTTKTSRYHNQLDVCLPMVLDPETRDRLAAEVDAASGAGLGVAPEAPLSRDDLM